MLPLVLLEAATSDVFSAAAGELFINLRARMLMELNINQPKFCVLWFRVATVLTFHTQTRIIRVCFGQESIFFGLLARIRRMETVTNRDKN